MVIVECCESELGAKLANETFTGRKHMPFAGQIYSFNTTWNPVPGVYGIMNASYQMIYIGQTDNFQRRMTEHANDREHCMHRHGPTYACAEVIHDQGERDRREAQLIAEYNPPCNQQHPTGR
jgi:predicted GIY-YIG superfamily endonuclease